MAAPGGCLLLIVSIAPSPQGTRRYDTQRGETGHFEGYQPARNCRKGGLFEIKLAWLEMALTKNTFKFPYGLICFPHLIQKLIKSVA